MPIDWKVLQDRMPKIGESLGRMLSEDMDLLISQEGKVVMVPAMSLEYRQQDGTRFTVKLSIEIDEFDPALNWDEPRK